ncbi:MAG: response regulator [Lachnospiraceae bacterium]|nr:response regulator [Lachnospiraceae bacterium]
MDSTMLIVDDVEMNREILKLLFHETYGILEAENGQEALEVLEACRGNIDIVLLDLMMPGLSGFELMEQRKELDFFKNVPVVVISSSGSMVDQVKAFEMGASDFIEKPFMPEIVISRVNNVIASHKRLISVELEA